MATDAAGEARGDDTRGDDAERDVVDSVPVRSLRSTVRGLLSIVAPTTLVVALLYYFGWARTAAEAHALGLDDSLFGYSSQDYVLRSVSSMYWPLFIGTVALLVGLMVHGLITAWLGDDTSNRDSVRAARVLAAAIGALGLALLVVGAIGANIEHPSRLTSIGAPLAVTVSIVLLAYAAHLVGRWGTGLGTDALTREARSLAQLGWSLVIVLVFLSLFWTVSHYAGVRGVDLAVEANKAIPFQPSVTIYSAKRLYLEQPVVETQLADPEAEYRYRYTGLKLLFRADDELFLRPSDQRDPRNIVIAQSPGVRFEYSH